MLRLYSLTVQFGGLVAVNDVSFQIEAQDFVSRVDPNGAGKTTLLRAIMGIVTIAQGEIRVGEKVLNQVKTWDMATLGIAMIPEGRMIFKDMSVEENLIMGAFPKQHRSSIKANLEHVYALFPHLKDRTHQIAGSLSSGEAQMLAMGRGLMSAPQIILINEPSLGLAPVIVNEVFAVLEQLKKEGRTIVLVEQNTRMALRIADHLHLMQIGKVLLSKPADQVDIDRLHDLYFAR